MARAGAHGAVSAAELARRLTAARLTIAVAESSAGGLIAAELTRVAGSSVYFRGGVVAYDDRSKTELLGIPEALFVEHGSVSAEAARAMSEAARRRFAADIGIGETGIAGPSGGTATKPVGSSFVAVSTAGGVDLLQAVFKGSREENRAAAVQMAIGLALELVPPP